MTNADRVRRMSDEELGALFNMIAEEGDLAFTSEVCRNCRGHHNGECPLSSFDDPCDPKYCPHGDDDMMNWLTMKSDAEKGKGEEKEGNK